MIESKKLQAPLTTKAASMRNINNALVDSGIRYGTQEFTLELRSVNSPNGVDSAVLEAGDILTVSVNGTVYSSVFATDTQNTINVLATNITANALVVSAKPTNDQKIVITVFEDIEIAVINPGVTNSTTNQLNVEETQELKVLVALNVINQEALSPSRIDIIGTSPNTTTYIGYALAGAIDGQPVWKISRVVETATSTIVLWADGNENMDNVWANRAALSYS
ncbi:hypothetical protein N9924_00080 [bacterium]|nr:hypothetical protein [bacterium]